LAEELKASVEEGVATKTDLTELKAELYKAMLAQTLVLIGTMVGLKLFGWPPTLSPPRSPHASCWHASRTAPTGIGDPRLGGGQAMKNATYEVDFYAWTVEQANMLRQGRFADADIANIVEEIDALGRSEKRELRTRLLVLLAHLLKWQAQPGRRGNSWRLTIIEQRIRLQEHLAQNPSLVPTLPDAIASVWRQVLLKTMRPTGFAEAGFPTTCPWTVEQILDEEFYPTGGR
jgi:uncharacterized protein DUF29